MRALHEFTNVSGSSADLDASDRNYSVAAARPAAARLRWRSAVASAAVFAQRGLRGVAHTRGESSARIKGATDTRRAGETLFLR